MSRPVIINAEPEGYSEEARAILREFAELREEPLSRRKLMTHLTDAFGLIVRLGHCVDDEMLAAAPRLRFVATATTGLNHVDLVATEMRGITVLSLKGEIEFLNNITATAEHTWGLLLALIRFIPGAVEHSLTGEWDRNLFKGRELSGLTLGIVGYGRLGRLVACYGKAFRMRVLAADPNPISLDEGIQYASLDEVLRQSDVVSLHVGLNPETYDLIGPEEFSRIKLGAYLVNTSRGEIVNEKALLAALESKRLAGAALDVLCDEVPSGAQWPNEHLLLAYARKHQNLLITPHIGGATKDAMHKTEIFMAEKIKRFWELLN